MFSVTFLDTSAPLILLSTMLVHSTYFNQMSGMYAWYPVVSVVDGIVNEHIQDPLFIFGESEA